MFTFIQVLFSVMRLLIAFLPSSWLQNQQCEGRRDQVFSNQIIFRYRWAMVVGLIKLLEWPATYLRRQETDTTVVRAYSFLRCCWVTNFPRALSNQSVYVSLQSCVIRMELFAFDANGRPPLSEDWKKAVDVKCRTDSHRRKLKQSKVVFLIFLFRS